MPARQRPEQPAAPDAADQVSLWERLERPAPAPRSTLTPDRIAEAAVRIADAEGLDAVTMRRLAGELGVAPMAAYRYVSGKDELLELMVDAVHGELPVPAAGAGWREVLRDNALHTRAMMLAHPWLPRAGVVVLTPRQMAAAEGMLAALDGLGLGPDTMMAAFATVSAYVRGAVETEIGVLRLMRERGWSTGQETREGLAPRMTWLMNTGRYPVYRRYTQEAVRKDDPAWRFETGLDYVLDGLAAHLDA